MFSWSIFGVRRRHLCGQQAPFDAQQECETNNEVTSKNTSGIHSETTARWKISGHGIYNNNVHEDCNDDDAEWASMKAVGRKDQQYKLRRNTDPATINENPFDIKRFGHEPKTSCNNADLWQYTNTDCDEKRERQYENPKKVWS